MVHEQRDSRCAERASGRVEAEMKRRHAAAIASGRAEVDTALVSHARARQRPPPGALAGAIADDLRVPQQAPAERPLGFPVHAAVARSAHCGEECHDLGQCLRVAPALVELVRVFPDRDRMLHLGLADRGAAGLSARLPDSGPRRAKAGRAGEGCEHAPDLPGIAPSKTDHDGS